MEEIWELIKDAFWLFVKMQWLKAIEKKYKKYEKLKEKTRQQAYSIHALVEKYNKIFKDDQIPVKRRDDRNGKET